MDVIPSLSYNCSYKNADDGFHDKDSRNCLQKVGVFPCDASGFAASRPCVRRRMGGSFSPPPWVLWYPSFKPRVAVTLGAFFHLCGSQCSLLTSRSPRGGIFSKLAGRRDNAVDRSEENEKRKVQSGERKAQNEKRKDDCRYSDQTILHLCALRFDLCAYSSTLIFAL